MQMPKSIKELPFKQYDAGNGGVKYKIDVSQVNINHEMMYLCEFTINSKYRKYNWYGCTVDVHSFRMLISKKEKDYRIFEEGKEKVSAPSLSNYIGTYTYCNISKKSEKLLKRLCGSKTTGNHEVDNLWHMLEEWKTAKIAKQRVESGYIDDAEVYKCPAEYPNGFFGQVREIVSNENVILYKKGNVRGRCFVCGEYVKTPYTQKFIQYQRQICPNCGAECLCILEDGAAWLADKVTNIITMQKGNDGTVWFRQFHIMRDETAKYSDISMYVREIGRYAIRGNKSAAWTLCYKEGGYFGPKTECRLTEWSRYKYADVYDGSYEFYCPNIDDVISGTSLQYSSLDGYIKNGEIKSKNPVRYCRQFIKYPVYEFLYKRGFYGLISDKVRGYNLGDAKNAIRWEAKRLKDCFKFPMRYLNFTVAQTWTLPSILKVNKMYSAGFSESEIKLAVISNIDEHYLGRIKEYVSVQKSLTYLKKQQTVSPNESINRLYGIYADYLEECAELEYNLKDKGVLFPQDLMKAHNDNIELAKIKKNEICKKKFAAAIKKFVKYDYTSGGLTIAVAQSPEQLAAEGSALHHCVGGYAERVSKGECVIFFVRRADKPDKPFYTLELRNKQLVQCRTLNNKSYESDKEVSEFVNKWLRKIRKGA